MYQALYRKYRPQTFDEVVGQKHITDTLKNQVKTGRLSHAYIFIGTRGTGKTTCARILAKAVNCENPVDGNPCGKCAACRGIQEGSIMDVVELDAASNSGVDSVRALRDEAVFSPADVKKRVYIIDEVHNLSLAAFNALLKILEEPPKHLMFILATTELHKVPATILSRCQRHIFHRIDTPLIAEHLLNISNKEGIKLMPQAAELIARLADGGVRDALSLLDQCSGAEIIDTEAVYSAMGLAGNRRIAEMLSKILKHDSPEVLKEFSGMWMDGKDPATLLTELSNLLRDILMIQVAPKGALELISGGYDTELLRSFAKRMARDEIVCALTTIQNSVYGLKDAKNPKTAVELCLLSLCDNGMGDSIKDLKARISRLEKQLSDGVFVIREMKDNYPQASEEPEHEEPKAQKPAYEEAPYDEPAYDEPPREEPEYDEPHCEEREYEDVPSGSYYPEQQERDYEEPEDALDYSAFQEEQPEDAFLERNGRDNKQEKSRNTVQDSALWAAISRQTAGLPMEIKMSIGDSNKVRGYVEGDTLHIDVIPGFIHKRFEKPEMLERFAQMARELSGKEMCIKLGDLVEDQRSARSLDELKKFKEVRFI